MSYPHKLLKPLPRRRLNHKSQSGVVIVIALFIVALVATMSYTMMARLTRDTKRVELISHDVQAALYADGSVMWAKDLLHNNWVKQKKNQRIDELPIESPVNDMDGYKISSVIKDAQGRFNLNNLSKPEWHQDFTRLMLTVYPKLSQANAEAITKATVDWILPGARDNELSRYYADLPVPYRPAHRFMVEVGEWRLVKGVTPELYAAMRPYLAALPTVTLINPQSAPVPVLMMLSKGMNVETATAIRELLNKNPPTTLEAFNAMDIIKNHPITEGRMTYVSEYFLVETEVTIERQHILLYTLLQRNNGNNAQVWVLSQNRGSG